MKSSRQPPRPPQTLRAGGAVAYSVLICLLLAAVTAIVYWPVGSYEYISFDDPDFVSANAQVLGGLKWESIRWAFDPRHGDYWHPLTWLSLMTDVSLFGWDAGGLHRVNALLHIVNTVWLFLLLRQWTGAVWRSGWVAGLFALHPLHVEAVAWVTARKDVLSTLFWLLTLWAYGRYAAGRGAQLSSGSGPCRKAVGLFYGLALLFFILGLMSKAMLITLPAVMLLLDVWPLARWPRARGEGPTGGSGKAGAPTRLGLIVEKIPFALLSLGSCVLTYWGQHRVRVALPVADDSLFHRIENAVMAYAQYVLKTFWPAHLAVSYPRPEHWPGVQVAAAVILIAGLCVAAIWAGRRRPYVFVGWFWFVGTLVPVIGLTKDWSQFMADRFTYVPSIGLFIIAAWGLGEWLAPRVQRLSWRVAVATAAALLLGLCAWRARDQLSYWHDTETLFRHALEVTEKNDFACETLGVCLARAGKVDEGIEWNLKALEINPRRASAHSNLGSDLTHKGLFDKAIEHCLEAIRLDPASAAPHINLGYALAGKGRTDEAIASFRKALEIEPDSAVAHNNLGFILASTGKPDEAMEHYEKSIALNPNYSDPHNNLGGLLFRIGRVDEAIAHYARAVQLAPRAANVRNNLGYVLAAGGRSDEAIASYRMALALDPNLTEAHNNLGNILAGQGRLGAAAAAYQESLRIDPGQAMVHLNLASALFRLERVGEAEAHRTEAIRLNPNLKDATFP